MAMRSTRKATNCKMLSMLAAGGAATWEVGDVAMGAAMAAAGAVSGSFVWGCWSLSMIVRSITAIGFGECWIATCRCEGLDDVGVGVNVDGLDRPGLSIGVIFWGLGTPPASPMGPCPA